jgi:outer membrane lipoprotein carrier protein
MKKPMRKIAALTLFALLCVATECYGLSVDELVTKVQRNYEKITDIQARFVQEIINKSLNRVKKAEGKVYFKKSGMMRWEYRKPWRHQLVTDGSMIWHYQPEDNQVIVGELSETIRAKISTAFLSGEGDLQRDFHILSPKGESKRDGSSFVLELAPLKPQADLQKLVLRVDPKRYLIVQTDIYDAFENINRIRFSAIKIDRNLPNSLFTFVAPPGTQVLRSPVESIR